MSTDHRPALTVAPRRYRTARSRAGERILNRRSTPTRGRTRTVRCSRSTRTAPCDCSYSAPTIPTPAERRWAREQLSGALGALDSNAGVWADDASERQLEKGL